LNSRFSHNLHLAEVKMVPVAEASEGALEREVDEKQLRQT